jgi:hypothetical protein
LAGQEFFSLLKSNNMKNGLTISILIPVLSMVLMSSGCKQNKSEDSAAEQTDTEVTSQKEIKADLAVVSSIDQQPVSNAVVYLGGSGSGGYVTTNAEGIAQITATPGAHLVGVVKRGFKRFTITVQLEAGSKTNVSLVPLDTLPAQVELKGMVVMEITAKGSRSENRFTKLKLPNQDKTVFLFNNMGINRGFDSFLNKNVRISGYQYMGLAGWEANEVSGVWVEEIEEL